MVSGAAGALNLMPLASFCHCSSLDFISTHSAMRPNRVLLCSCLAGCPNTWGGFGSDWVAFAFQQHSVSRSLEYLFSPHLTTIHPNEMVFLTCPSVFRNFNKSYKAFYYNPMQCMLHGYRNCAFFICCQNYSSCCSWGAIKHIMDSVEDAEACCSRSMF